MRKSEIPPTAGKHFGIYVDRSGQTCHHQKNLFFISKCTIKTTPVKLFLCIETQLTPNVKSKQ